MRSTYSCELGKRGGAKQEVLCYQELSRHKDHCSCACTEREQWQEPRTTCEGPGRISRLKAPLLPGIKEGCIAS